MTGKTFITVEEKDIFKIHLKDPFSKPVLIENEDQFKDLVNKLKSSGKGEEAKFLTECWVNYWKNSFKINYKGKFLNLGNKTAVMGILNCTPDSFSDGGNYYKKPEKSVERIKEMLDEGADIIDIGGESTRPGAEPVPEEEELERVIPVISLARKELGNDFLISIDTYKSSVAEAALNEGADIVNDISGMTFDERMINVVSKYDCPIILNHTKGKPDTMQKDVYYDDVVLDISEFFRNQINKGLQKGIRKDRFIIDPGIGFGKNVEHNVEIIKRLKEFKFLGLPVMIGISRKSFVGKILKSLLSKDGMPSPEERVFGGLGATALAVLNGVHIVRTHDVKETVEFLIMIDTIRGYRVV
ncbi:dihydropteroate synthase [Persephonella sp.]